MQTNQGYTTVTVVQHQPGGFLGGRGPVFMQQGLQIGGLALGAPLVIYVCVAGGMFMFAGMMMMITSGNDLEFWAKFGKSYDPMTLTGGIIFTIGCIGLACGIYLCFYMRKKYNSLLANNPNNDPGRVINRSPVPPHAPVGAATAYPTTGPVLVSGGATNMTQYTTYPMPGGGQAVPTPGMPGYQVPMNPMPPAGGQMGAYPPVAPDQFNQPPAAYGEKPPPYSDTVGGQMNYPSSPGGLSPGYQGPGVGQPSPAGSRGPSPVPGTVAPGDMSTAPEYKTPPAYAPNY